MRLYVFYIVICLTLLASCDKEPYPGYSALGLEGAFYKVITFDEQGRKPQHGDMLRFKMGLLEGGSLAWESHEVQVMRYDTTARDLKSELARFHAGDSLSIYLDAKAFKREFGQEPSTTDKISDVRLRILDVISEKNWLEAKALDRGIKSKREQLQIEKYLANRSDSAAFSWEHGMWVKRIQKGNAGVFTPQEELLLMYTATLLDGTIIDRRSEAEDALSYKLGMQGQLIPGLMVAIKHMDREDELEIILPSNMAFGERGSAGDVVLPWTPVHYTLRVVLRETSPV